MLKLFNPLAAEFFSLPFRGMEIIFYKSSPGTDFLFQCLFTVWHSLVSLVLLFPDLRIESPHPSTVQGKCIYTFLKQRTRKFNLCSCTKPCKDKHKVLVKINIRFVFQRSVDPGSIYRPSVPHNRIEQTDLSTLHVTLV